MYFKGPLNMQSPLIEKVLAREAGTEIAQHEEEGQTLQCVPARFRWRNWDRFVPHVKFASTAHAAYNIIRMFATSTVCTIGVQLFLSTQTMWRLVQTRVIMRPMIKSE